MPDRGLIWELVAQGVDRDTAEDMISRVEDALRARLAARKSVAIAGVGTLRAKKRRRWLPGTREPRRAVEEVLVNLAHPAVLHQGEPYEA